MSSVKGPFSPLFIYLLQTLLYLINSFRKWCTVIILYCFYFIWNKTCHESQLMAGEVSKWSFKMLVCLYLWENWVGILVNCVVVLVQLRGCFGSIVWLFWFNCVGVLVICVVVLVNCVHVLVQLCGFFGSIVWLCWFSCVGFLVQLCGCFGSIVWVFLVQLYGCFG